jgi:hypothetical protein
MANLFGFIDETGVLYKDPIQRFYALGLLKLAQTAPLYGELVLLRSRVLAELTRLEKPFEFKFNEINRTNYKHYKTLIDLYFSFPQAAFCSLVVDKEAPGFQIEKYFHDVWEAYIGYSRLLVHKNVASGDEICILADYFSKPKASTRYYEVELAKPDDKGTHPVFNVCMLESHASLYIQLVDVLVGCVVYDFRLRSTPSFKPNEFKKGLVDLVRRKLVVDSLAGELTKNKPNYFSILPLKAK